jgi:hypothetical protein
MAKRKEYVADFTINFTITHSSQGFLQNKLILATFANAHLAHLATDHPGDEKPIGVLILSMQAVSGARSRPDHQLTSF